MTNRATLLLLTLGLVAAPLSAQESGGALFAKYCGTCHVDPHGGTEERRIGPALDGVVGRKAASRSDYTRYSSALRASGRVWTESALDAYFAAPMTAVPGTTMAMVSPTTAGERATLIAYLKSAR